MIILLRILSLVKKIITLSDEMQNEIEIVSQRKKDEKQIPKLRWIYI